MKKYQVDGMCIYHYWFENGRRILEKPAENLLEWKDIQMPFCFYWANQTWARTWKKLKEVNVWSTIYNKPDKRHENDILLKQSYGRERDWEEHFIYLLSFFKDERYIKLDNRPVFVIYRPDDIVSLWDMADYFNRRAIQSGFQGIYFIGSGSGVIPGLNATFERQPDGKTNSYTEMWKMTLENKIVRGSKTYFCGGVDYDNSPRMGKAAFVLKDVSPSIFYANLKKLYKKSMLLENEFLFINAWNEWGEGTYLEPDEKYRFGYLEALKKVVDECQNEMLDDMIINYETEEETKLKEQNRIRSRYVELLHNWLCLKEQKVDFAVYFKKYGYKNIAIYDMGKLGMHLLNELRESNVTVCYGIDENSEKIQCEVDIYKPEQETLKQIDAVVITITNQCCEIAEKLRQNINCPMISIEEIIQELM